MDGALNHTVFPWQWGMINTCCRNQHAPIPYRCRIGTQTFYCMPSEYSLRTPSPVRPICPGRSHSRSSKTADAYGSLFQFAVSALNRNKFAAYFRFAAHTTLSYSKAGRAMRKSDRQSVCLTEIMSYDLFIFIFVNTCRKSCRCAVPYSF